MFIFKYKSVRFFIIIFQIEEEKKCLIFWCMAVCFNWDRTENGQPDTIGKIVSGQSRNARSSRRILIYQLTNDRTLSVIPYTSGYLINISRPPENKIKDICIVQDTSITWTQHVCTESCMCLDIPENAGKCREFLDRRGHAQYTGDIDLYRKHMFFK